MKQVKNGYQTIYAIDLALFEVVPVSYDPIDYISIRYVVSATYSAPYDCSEVQLLVR